MDRGTWWDTGHGVTKSQTQLKQLSTHGSLNLGSQLEAKDVTDAMLRSVQASWSSRHQLEVDSLNCLWLGKATWLVLATGLWMEATRVRLHDGVLIADAEPARRPAMLQMRAAPSVSVLSWDQWWDGTEFLPACNGCIARSSLFQPLGFGFVCFCDSLQPTPGTRLTQHKLLRGKCISRGGRGLLKIQKGVLPVALSATAFLRARTWGKIFLEKYGRRENKVPPSSILLNYELPMLGSFLANINSVISWFSPKHRLHPHFDKCPVPNQVTTPLLWYFGILFHLLVSVSTI